jgi:hypothetical protein
VCKTDSGQAIVFWLCFEDIEHSDDDFIIIAPAHIYSTHLSTSDGGRVCFVYFKFVSDFDSIYRFNLNQMQRSPSPSDNGKWSINAPSQKEQGRDMGKWS